eukprot:868812-Pyramimonas_sp.AAC.1
MGGLDNPSEFGGLGQIIASDWMSKVNSTSDGAKSPLPMRHLASEIDRLDSRSLRKSRMLSGRAILLTIAVHHAIRQDQGQMCACQGLMAIAVRGSVEQADCDLFHVYPKWMRTRGRNWSASQIAPARYPRAFL